MLNQHLAPFPNRPIVAKIIIKKKKKKAKQKTPVVFLQGTLLFFIMLGSWAAGMKHSFFTFKIYTCQYLTKIRTVPETIKTAILIKCVKPIQCPWYIKEFKNFNNNSNIQKKKLSPRCGRVLESVSIWYY